MAVERAKIRVWLSWVVAAFFVVGGLGNIFPTDQIEGDYARWGYP